MALRRPPKRELVIGVQPLKEALAAGVTIEKVWAKPGLAALKDLRPLLRDAHVPVQQVPIQKLDAMVPDHNHQGIIAFRSAVDYASADEIIAGAYDAGADPLLVALDGVTDVRNLGGIARSAECLGADGLVVPERGGARLGSDALKASAGALLHLPICRTGRLDETLYGLKSSGLRIVALTEHSHQDLHTADLTGPLCLLLGDEGKGIQRPYLELADLRLRIPMLGQINSLNVSVAAGISLYEIQRQRGL
jgi:23S rRNA (guanosine2251-2'-O)-methyltransferase